MSDPERETVFVYGTLKTGHGNHYAFLRNAESLGEATTDEPFILKRGPGFPYATEPKPYRDLGGDHDARPIAGEVFRVDAATLRDLDRLEGCPTHYYRRRVGFREPGAPHRAWIYIVADAERVEDFPNCDILDGAYHWERTPIGT